MITDKQLLELQRDYEKLKAENAELKKKKKFGLVWEEQSSEKNIDDKEHYPFLATKGDAFGFDNGEARKNILIEGDNYHALEILQYTHKGAVDVIYIDPPYNTGKKKEFRYNDHWVDKEDGYRHSKWLTFMDKRLRLARELLKKEGVVFISIDDNEQARLKILCDDIFGEKCYGGVFAKKISGGKNDSKTIKVNHEYLLCYRRTENTKLKLNRQISAKETTVTLQKWGDNEERENRENLWYPIYANIESGKISLEQEDGMIEILPIKNDGTERYWRWEKETTIKDIAKLKLVKLEDDFGDLKYDIHVIMPKGAVSYLPWSSFIPEFSAGGGKVLKDTIGKKIPGMYPKNLDYIKWIVGLSLSESPVILDFFAGSGTTGHAVMDLALKERERERAISADEEASRVTYNPQFILVTNNENNICEEVCYERLKRANEKYGYGSNLEYLKTELLEYDPKRHCDLDIRAFMVEKITEIIKVREACFKIEPITNYLQKFVKDEKSVYVLHNVYDMKPQDYKDAIEILAADSNDNINIYVLAMSNHAHYAQKLYKCGKNITFEPLPESFLKLLRKIDTNIRKTK